MCKTITFSVVICTLNRTESLNRLKSALRQQDRDDYELIICTEVGPLVELKEKSWRKAKGRYVIFCDDDIQPHLGWFNAIDSYFKVHPNVVGITGPTYVPKEYMQNRDVFKDGLFKKFYNWFFLEGKMYYPGFISRWGVNALGANYPTPLSVQYHSVDFLEPSQGAYRRSTLEKIDGFDTGFGGVGEWGDVDMSYRASKHGVLIYHPKMKCYHYPEQDKAVYTKRLETKTRYDNYCRWADRHITPSFRNKLYRLFLQTYFFAKRNRFI